MWMEELKIWLFKIDKLTTSINMYHAFVLLINRTGTDIIAILVFKLELNKCFAFRLYYKYYDSPIHCYCDSFYTYWHTTVGSLGFRAFPRHGPVPLCLCPWKCCFCTLEKGHRIKWHMSTPEISKITHYWEIKQRTNIVVLNVTRQKYYITAVVNTCKERSQRTKILRFEAGAFKIN